MRIGSFSHYYCLLRGLILPGYMRIGKRTLIRQGACVDAYRGRIVIGRSCRIHRGSIIDAQKGTVEIGSNVSVNAYAILWGAGGIKIGDNVRIASHSVIVSFDHNFEDRDRPITSQGVTHKPIVIEDDVWIGAGAKILGGSHISKGCVIGANAVLKGKTDPFGIYVGSPARLLKFRGGQGK